MENLSIAGIGWNNNKEFLILNTFGVNPNIVNKLNGSRVTHLSTTNSNSLIVTRTALMGLALEEEIMSIKVHNIQGKKVGEVIPCIRAQGVGNEVEAVVEMVIRDNQGKRRSSLEDLGIQTFNLL